MREPIAKLRLSALSKARSPSPLPSPSGRGSIIGTVFLIVFVLTAFAALSAPAAPMKIEVQLIWGTTNQVSPNAEHKAIGPELKKKLQDLPLKWTNYFMVKKMTLAVPRGQATNVAMSEKCSIGIKDLGKTMLEISFVGKNKPLEKRTQSLPRGEVFIYSGNAPGTNDWLVVLKRLE